MSRVKRGVPGHRRHKKVVLLAKGFRGLRSRVYKIAKIALMKAGKNAYRDRRLKKRTFHRLWIARLNAAVRAKGVNYSRFIYGLMLAKIKIDRKMLADLAIHDEAVFNKIFDLAKSKL